MQHLAFIMDGNRTWAKSQGLPTFEGHRQGFQKAKEIIKLVKKRDIPYVSLWALSDDNIRSRTTLEVKYLFELLAIGILDVAKEAQEDGNRLVVVGDRGLLPQKCQENIAFAENLTKDEKGLTIIIAVGYGGQEEVVRAVRQIVEAGITPKDITKETILHFIETAIFPPPDLIIRTGGHIRHSGFFLFQSPYAEYFFSEKNWPEFDEGELDRAIRSFHNSERKFGK